MTESVDKFKPFHAGFNLSGKRGEDGKLHPFGSGESMDDWPLEIEWQGNVYCLEDVVKGNDGFEEGVYC